MNIVDNYQDKLETLSNKTVHIETQQKEEKKKVDDKTPSEKIDFEKLKDTIGSVTKIQPIEEEKSIPEVKNDIKESLLNKYIDSFWEMNCPDTLSLLEIEE